MAGWVGAMRVRIEPGTGSSRNSVARLSALARDFRSSSQSHLKTGDFRPDLSPSLGADLGPLLELLGQRRRELERAEDITRSPGLVGGDRPELDPGQRRVGLCATGQTDTVRGVEPPAVCGLQPGGRGTPGPEQPPGWADRDRPPNRAPKGRGRGRAPPDRAGSGSTGCPRPHLALSAPYRRAGCDAGGRHGRDTEQGREEQPQCRPGDSETDR